MVKCIQKLVVDVPPPYLILLGVEAGKVRLAEAKNAQSAWKREITDVESDAGWVSSLQPIIEALLNMGLKLCEIHGNQWRQEVFIVEN